MITGASSGLGAALAGVYSAPGNQIFLFGRNQSRLAATADAVVRKGATAEAVSLDVRDTDRLISEIRKIDAKAPLDLAIFNAGVGGISSPKHASESSERVKEVAEVNFVAPLIGASLVAELMAARGRGRIVLIGSIAQHFPLPMAPSYSAAKAGLAMFSEGLRIRIAKHGVMVTLVSPGFIDTPMNHGMEAPKPFLITAERAADIIQRKVARGAERIVVPWQFSIIGAAAAFLPRSLVAAVLKRV